MSQQVQAPPDAVAIGQPHRPGLVTFAAVMLFVLAAFYTVATITEWSNSVWLYQRNFKVAGSSLVFWGIVDSGLAILSVTGGYLLIIGHRMGQILGFIFAGIGFVRWLFYIPADPWLAIAILAVDGMIIYGLSANDDWFASRQT